MEGEGEDGRGRGGRAGSEDRGRAPPRGRSRAPHATGMSTHVQDPRSNAWLAQPSDNARRTNTM